MKNKFFRLIKKRDQQPARHEIEIEIPTTPHVANFSPNRQEGKTGKFGSVHVQPQLMAACAQSVGKARDHNEDSVFCMTTFTGNLGQQRPAGLYIVADGMGGHQQGEVASDIAIRSIAHEVIQRFFLEQNGSVSEIADNELEEMLGTAVMQAHQLIAQAAPGSGTTLTSALINNGKMTLAHVGDSRLYLINSDHVASVLTRDHSLVNRMIELGHLTEEEAAVHPQRNVLYRALGQGEIEPEISTHPLPKAGYLMLCSDGLWGVVPQKEIVRIISENSDIGNTVQELVDAANHAGGPDNISVILVRLPTMNLIA